jgi:diacylglycerol kinase family enzyme
VRSRHANAAALPLAVIAAGVSSAWWSCAQTAGCNQQELDEADADELVEKAWLWVRNFRTSGSLSGSEEWVDEMKSSASGTIAGKRVLVFVNPKSGPAKAEEHSKFIVEPMLRALGCNSIEVQLTDAKEGARKLMSDGDLSDLDGIIVLGGEGTLKEVIGGLAEQSLQNSSDKSDKSIHNSQGIDVLHLPVGFVPEGNSNGLISTMLTVPTQPSDEETVRAVLRIARWSPKPVRFMQCQTDSGLEIPAISSGVRMTSAEAVANRAAYYSWLRLPNLTRKLVEMWAVYKMHTYSLRIAYLAADSKSVVPSFEDWDDRDPAWQVIEGDFMWAGVATSLPGDASDDPACESACAYLAWAFDHGSVSRTSMEALLRANLAEDDLEPQDLLKCTAVKAFSIETQETKENKRKCSIDGDAIRNVMSPHFTIRGRMHEQAFMLL